MEEVKWWASPHGSDWEDVRGPVLGGETLGMFAKETMLGILVKKYPRNVAML